MHDYWHTAMTEALRRQLIKHEGERLSPYRDTVGKLTIGVGRNLDSAGISRDESRYMLDNDIRVCLFDLLSIFPEFVTFENSRKYALIDLRFNLGGQGFRTFKRMILAVQNKAWDQAAEELKDSKWWTQVQFDRKITLFNQLLWGWYSY